MNILIIKTSSLGDVIHTLPALTDAGKAIPDIQFDWVVEEAFQDIPKMHPLVNTVIPVAMRRWRKNIFRSLLGNEFKQFKQKIKSKKYDLIIDAQGLIKSGFITHMANGKKVGLDKQSLTESLARFFYDQHVTVDLQKHAVFRMRSIFSQALNYSFNNDDIDYGISLKPNAKYADKPYILFFHGTTWPSKHWPDEHWMALATLINDHQILIPWSNETEKIRAEKIAAQSKNALVLPKMPLADLAPIIAGAKYCIGIDSGLAHLAAALAIPTITLYGPTNPARIGTAGKNQLHLQSKTPCQCQQQKVCRFKSFSSKCLTDIAPQEILTTIKISFSRPN
jgi:heptosyltransferase-1